ncbi:DNA-binding protein TRF1 homologue, putative, partial [Candida dubliniensis CD36]
TKSTINKKLKLLQKCIYDNLIDKIKELDIEKDTIERIESVLNKPKRKPPFTPLEKQCGKLTKKGERCRIAVCYKKTCWVHLTPKEIEEYRELNKSILILI